MTDAHCADIRAKMAAEQLWDDGFRGAGIGVAILDSGFRPNDPVPERILDERDFTDEARPRHAGNRHGSTVAECVSCLAPEAKLGNFRVIPQLDMTRETVVQAVNTVIELYPRYRVMNLSLYFEPDGCPENCELCAALDRAFRAGILVVCAAGNAGPEPDSLTCPARANWVLASTATWSRSVGDYWDQNRLKEFWMRRVTGSFGQMYGTSYSAGYLSGAAAMLLSAFPEVDADTLRFAMLKSANADAAAGYATARLEQMRQELARLQALVRAGAMVTKSGSLHTFVAPF
jgi:subtilisin family serine protease